VKNRTVATRCLRFREETDITLQFFVNCEGEDVRNVAFASQQVSNNPCTVSDGIAVMCCGNPLINDVSKETISLKEGCLSFPFLFLLINRPKWVSVRYTNENSEEVEETLHGMAARIFQHENEHMNGYIFTDLVSKFKLDRAKKAQKKLIKETIRRRNA